MSKTFATMQANVGNNVQNSDTDFATLIGVWLNDAYRDIARRCLWSDLIDFDKTFTSIAGSATYTLATDFDEEVYVADKTNGHPLKRYTEGKWWEEYNNQYDAATIANGNPVRYVIREEANKIMLDPPPDTSSETYAIPYKKSITDLTSADTPSIRDVELAMEMYAIAQAWAYERQFAKADWYMQRYEIAVAQRISQERSKPNQRYQMISQSYRVLGLRQLTGDRSYDSI